LQFSTEVLPFFPVSLESAKDVWWLEAAMLSFSDEDEVSDDEDINILSE
jgi:hypothetical protein